MGLFGFFNKRNGRSESGEAIDPALAEQISEWVTALKDEDWQVRLRACESLGELGPKAGAAAPKLQELIDDEHGDVCLAAAAALSKIEREL